MLLGRFRLDEENIQISRGKKINILNYTKNSNINALSFLDMSSGVTTNARVLDDLIYQIRSMI